MKNADYQILDADDSKTITGLLNTAQPEGICVALNGDPADEDQRELILADGVRAHVLQRAAVAAADKDHLREDRNVTNFRPPVIVGEASTAIRPRRMEVEGPALVDKDTATRLLDGATPLDTELTTLAGKWAIRNTPASQELAGWLRQIKAPVTTANGERFLIEVAQ